jgi:hypothetical protein
MFHKSHLITLALFAAAQLAGCVAVTGTGATVDPAAVDGASADKSSNAGNQAVCAPGTSSTADKPCTKKQTKN